MSVNYKIARLVISVCVSARLIFCERLALRHLEFLANFLLR